MKALRLVSCALTVLLAVGVLAGSGAGAVELPRVFSSNPAGRCQAALPAFEGQIRKRPLAIQNEGTAAAFVSCAFRSQVSATELQAFTLAFASFDGATHSVSCTGITGYNTGTNQYMVKTVTVPATGQSALSWIPADFGGAFNYNLLSVSCSLQPGAGINQTIVNLREDVGE